MFMKKMLLLAGLAAASLFSSYVHAQQIPQGPFQNQSQLVAAWQQFDPYGMGFAYLDGALVFQRSGFGPAASGKYYVCPGDP